MLRRLLAALLTGVLLTGCATFTDAELGAIQRRGVSARVMTKLEIGRVVTPEDVIELTRRGVPDGFIIRQIENAGIDYVLTSEDHQRLEKAGVSPAVIDALVADSEGFAGRYATPRELYISDPYYDDYYYDDPYYGRRAYSRETHGSGGVGISPFPRRLPHHRWR